MPNVIRSAGFNKRPNDNRIALDVWGYPSGMVWCPMKMSGMALMKCAELQKQFGCGTIRQLKITSLTKPDTCRFSGLGCGDAGNVPNEPTINRCVNYD